MLRNKLLASSFVASFALNAVFLVLVGNSDLFQHADVIRDLRAQQIEVYKPPILEKPRPKPKITPPKPKPVPKTQPAKPVARPAALPQPSPTPKPAVLERPRPHLQTSRPPVPRFRPQPASAPAQPERPARAQPVVRPAVNLGSHTAQGIAVAPNPAQVVRPVVTPAPPASAPVVQPQPAPTSQPKPTPVVEAPVPKPAPTVEQPKPKPTLADRGSPEIIGSWDDLQLPDSYDPNSISRTTIPARWVVDKTGHARGISFPSSGNPDIDEAIRDFIQKHHYEPAVQNGEAEDSPIEHTFVIGQ